MNLDLNHFKQKLAAEKLNLENQLNDLGKKNPNNPNDWEAKPSDDSDISFRDEIADRFEEQDERKAMELSLETDLQDLNLALSKIAAGTYGLCEVDQQPIELDRLEANPAARTCKQHLDQI
jgi:DnaK suppressor protein